MLGGRYHPSLCERPQAGLWLGPRGHKAGKGVFGLHHHALGVRTVAPSQEEVKNMAPGWVEAGVLEAGW